MAYPRRDVAAMVASSPTLAWLGFDLPDWYDDALCAQTDPEQFYPERGGSVREAKKVCAACPVREQCRAHALANDEHWGVWGGLSEFDRRRMRAAERKAS